MKQSIIPAWAEKRPEPEVTALDVAEAVAGMVGIKSFYEREGASRGALELCDKISRCLRELDKRMAASKAQP